jgi:hypothetical protein
MVELLSWQGPPQGEVLSAYSAKKPKPPAPRVAWVFYRKHLPILLHEIKQA